MVKFSLVFIYVKLYPVKNLMTEMTEKLVRTKQQQQKVVLNLVFVLENVSTLESCQEYHYLISFFIS